MSIKRWLIGATILLGMSGNSAHAVTCTGTQSNSNISWAVQFDATTSSCAVTDLNGAVSPNWLSFQAMPLYNADAYFALWAQGGPVGAFDVNGISSVDLGAFSYIQQNLQGLVTATIIGEVLGTLYSMTVNMRADGGNNIYLISASVSPISAVPIPAALPLLATGLGALGVIGWRRKRKLTQAQA